MLYKKMIPPIVIPRIPDDARNIKFLLLKKDFLFVLLLNREARSKKKSKNGKRIALAKITLKFFNPKVKRINAIDQKMAVINAVSCPLRPSFISLLLLFTDTMITPKNIMTAPKRYLKRNGSPKNIVARTMVIKG